MRKVLPILLATTVFLTPLYPVYAQTATTPSVKRIAKPTAATATGSLKPQPILDRMEKIENRVENKMEKVEDRMENLKDRMASRAAQLKAKLQKFKDKAKAQRVESINTNLNNVNQRRTENMQKNLAKISQLLNKLKSWVAEQKTNGKDVTEAEKLIADTQALWTEASSALTDQSDNDYSIVVNTESTVKSDAMTARDNLRTDLKAVHDKMVSLRQSLAKAISTARSSLGGQNNGTEQ